MSRHIVCLTFDHDHLSGFIARGQTTPTAISRGEYDVVVIPRLVSLLERYGIKATFFTPWTHRLPASLSRDEEEEEIVRGNESIRRISGKLARGYRSPAWDLSPHSIELLQKHGIQYDSSLMGHDYDCYFARQGDVAELKTPFVRGRETTLVEMPISWSLDDYPHFEYMRLPNGSVMPGLMNATNVLENFVDDFTYMMRVQPDFGILTYTFHPHVIGRGHRMMMLERLIQKLMEGGAVFMTMEAAMHEWLARQHKAGKIAAE